MGNFIRVKIINTTIKYRVSWLCVVWSIVISFVGPLVACTMSEFSNLKPIVDNFFVSVRCPGSLLAQALLWRSPLQLRCLFLIPTTGVVVKMREVWWLVIVLLVLDNGFVLSVWG